MNWKGIRVMNGSQNDGFEELVCQLAQKEPIARRKAYYRKGKPDGGVECYCELYDGNEIVWQAKYFTDSLTNTQWDEIDKSVKTALKTHPKMRRYIIAMPLDPPDARIKGQKSMRAKWNEHVTKWQEWATAEGTSVCVEPWWASDMITRLARPENVGLQYFFFHEQEFTTEWMVQRNERTIANLGVRYTPELNVELDIAKIFDGLLRNERFYNLFYKALDKLLTAGYKVLRYCRDLEPFKDDIAANLKKVREAFDINQVRKADVWIPIQQYCNVISELSDSCDRAMGFYTEEEYKEQEKLKEYRFYHKYGSEIHFVRELQGALHTFSRFINSPVCELADKRYLLLTGVGGVGKSHLFADIVEKADEGSTLLLLGQHFTTQDDPWTQIKRICEINCTEPEFFGALNAKAESEQRRIVLMIDAANEGKGKLFWKDHINGFLTMIAKYEWLGLAISVRSSYTRLLFPEDSVTQFVRFEHEGFGDKMGEAVRVYFNGYGLTLPDIPLLHAEFQKPLFLKLYCEGQKNGAAMGREPLNQLETVIKNYVSGLEKQLAERLHYSESHRVLLKSVDAIVDYQIANHTTVVGYDEAYAALDAISQHCHIEHNLLDELVSEGVFTKNLFPDDTEKIYFAYERLGDYSMAKRLVERVDAVETAFAEGGELHEYVKDMETCMQNQGLIEAWSIIVPSKTGREFFEYVPHVEDRYVIAECVINSLIWRHIEEVPDALRDYLGSINNRGLRILFRDTCLSIATVPHHAFNAEFLHQQLSGMALADRDSWWVPLLKRQWEYESPIKTLINWAWSDEDKSHLSNDSVRLAGITLGWCLASTNRNLRDSATKALVSLLKDRIGVLIEVLRLFEGVYDPYVYERLYAAALGCAVRLEDRSKLTELSTYVYETIFKDKEEVYPHVLLRDYAREIIEYAHHKGCALKFAMEEVRPPYRSAMPEQFPSNDEIDTRYEVDVEAPDYKKYHFSQKKILKSMVTEHGRGVGGYGNFGRYVFQGELSCFDVDYNGLSNYAVQLIFEKYGYDKEKHGRFDSEIVDDDTERRGEGVYNERIGKKYQWIALYEILARVSDNCTKHEEFYSEVIEPYHGPWNPEVRDIDPTILIRNGGDADMKHERYWWEVETDIRMDEENKEWMQHTRDLPEPKNFISLTDNEGEEWLALQNLPEWREEKHLGDEEYDKPRKKVWYTIRSYLVKDKDFAKVRKSLTGKNFREMRMPEVTSWSELFSREYYWSPGYEDKDTQYCEDGKKSDERELYDDEMGKYVADCYMTAKAYSWSAEYDKSKDSSFYIFKPTKLLYDELGLNETEKEGEYADAAGQVMCFDPSVYHDTFSALLIRKRPLVEWLQRKRLRIIWTLLSEKQILGGLGASNSDVPAPLDICGVYYLNNKAVLQGNCAICPIDERKYARRTKDEDEKDEIDEWFEQLAERYLEGQSGDEIAESDSAVTDEEMSKSDLDGKEERPAE